MLTGQQQPSYPEELVSGSIEQQVEYLFNRSSDYANNGVRYKVSRTREFEKLRDNILDSLTSTRNSLKGLEKTIKDQNNLIKDLNKRLEETSESLNQISAEKDSFTFLGNQMSKGTYNLIIWTIILMLLALLGHFIFRFSRSNVLTQEARGKLSDLEMEFEEHRRKALEREQRISRQLHDEINKNRKAK